MNISPIQQSMMHQQPMMMHQQPMMMHQQPMRSMRKNSSNTTILLVGGFILILVIVSVGYFLLYSKQQYQNSSTSSSPPVIINCSGEYKDIGCSTTMPYKKTKEYNITTKRVLGERCKNSNGEYITDDNNNILPDKKKIEIDDVSCKPQDANIFRIPSMLLSGQFLGINQNLTSPNGKYNLMFENGRLVLYKTGTWFQKKEEIWTSGVGSANCKLVNRKDGNLVLYDDNTGKAIWSSNTYSENSTTLILQDDGNLVLYNKSSSPVWSTNTVY
jgi:hypothetical protein